MSLLKKKKKKPLVIRGGGGAGGQVSSDRPLQKERLPPCLGNCASGTDIRGWITTIAQHEKSGLDDDRAMARAWEILVDANPFPAVMGRVCPHPCEAGCNRVESDGAVAVNALERFIGDWALEQGLQLPMLDDSANGESVGVIGAGPAGLSFAYQMARRGYKVTVYERNDKPGGMLYYGIPFYRLPADVLGSEIQRILNLGIELKLNTVIGRDITVEGLRSNHDVLFLGIGAHQGKPLRIPKEDGPGLWTGTDYLNRINSGESVEVGKHVVVIGGGDTAIDAARVARRTGAAVTIVYRRTRTEMPAIESEIEDALKEGIEIEYLLAPVGLDRNGSQLKSVVVQKMELGEPDDSGRRRPVPIAGSELEMAVDSVISAVSQVPDWEPLAEVKPKNGWLEPDGTGKVEDDLWAGGDVLNLGIAATAIAHGRRSAEAVHAKLRGLPAPVAKERPPVTREQLKVDYYEPSPRTERAQRPVSAWLKEPNAEIDEGITKEQFLKEVGRCFSCGLCFGCERCWMFCTPSCFVKEGQTAPGSYYSIKLDTCDGCRKCADACPCGFLEII